MSYHELCLSQAFISENLIHMILAGKTLLIDLISPLIPTYYVDLTFTHWHSSKASCYFVEWLYNLAQFWAGLWNILPLRRNKQIVSFPLLVFRGTQEMSNWIRKIIISVNSHKLSVFPGRIVGQNGNDANSWIHSLENICFDIFQMEGGGVARD